MIITNAAELQPVYDFIAANSRLAYDSESTGLNVRKETVIGFCITNATEGFYLCHKTWEDGQLVEKLPYSVCQDILRKLQGKELITWNASFDIRITMGYFKVDLLNSLYSDGILAFHTTQEEGVPFKQSPFGLKTVAPHFLGPDVISEQADMKASIKANGGSAKEFYKADLEPMARYCLQDGKLTYQLNERFMEQIKREGLWNFYFEQEVMPLYREVLIPMERKGLPIDLQLLESARLDAAQDLAQLETTIQAKIKPLLTEFEAWFLNKDYPPRRSGQFVQAAIELLAPGSLPRTGTGNYSTASAAIGQMPKSMLKDWLHEPAILIESYDGTTEQIDGNPKLRYLPDEIVKKIQLQMHGDQSMFNLLSKHHLKKLFFEKLGETPLSTTETGLPQCDEIFLDSVAHKYDWVPLLIDFNKITKIKSAYIERLLEEHEDGIWYPSFSLHRTISGRLGSDAQQFPRPLEPGQASDLVIKHNNKIRHFFKAPEGHKFGEADYESLEPKVFAHVSGDPRIQEIFQRGLDFYSHIAIMTEGLKGVSADKKAPNYLGKVDKVKRQAAKPYSLGIPYGMTGYKLQFELNIPQKEADQLVRNYLEAFPDLARWMDETASKVYTNGFIQVETGRKRRFPRAVTIFKQYGEAILHDLKLWKQYNSEPAIYAQAKKARREFKNYINNGNNVQIQGLAASIVNRACIKIARAFKEAGLKTQICLQVHDSICVIGPDSELAKVGEIMQTIMEGNYKISVPLIAEPKFGQTYADTK